MFYGSHYPLTSHLPSLSSNLILISATTELNVHKFVAKIGSDNVPSLQLFKKKVGFVEVHKVLMSIIYVLMSMYIVFCRYREVRSSMKSHWSYL